MSATELLAWAGRTETVADTLCVFPARGLAALFDLDWVPQAGETLPPLWAWLYFLAVAPQSGIGPDGHPKRGGFLPPVALERRMWAGGRLSFHGPLRLGEPARKRSEILKIEEKDGKAGPMVFVTVRHEVTGAAGLAIAEEQDIVYLRMPDRFAPPPGKTLPDGLAFEDGFAAGAVALFRFSALTFNGHRIHYDLPYARDVEKYPGLVVHGPLQALLLFEAARRRHPGRPVTAFDFRAVRPLFDFDRVRIAGKPDGAEALDLFTANGDGLVSMQARLTFGEA
jgi:3-methylfumaryl-CoA hydratase